MKIRKSALVLIAGLALAGYGGLIAWFRSQEDALVFHPDRGRLVPPPDSLRLDAQRVLLLSPDSVPLVAWVIPPPPGAPGGAPWLLYCHGNGGWLGSLGYQEAWSRLRALGMGILAMDYRGYGESGGSPSEAGFYRDAGAAYDYLRDSLGLGVPPARIVIYGFSLGSAVAVDLAARVEAAGLIVEGALLSIPQRGKELYPFLPVERMTRNRFASSEKIGRVDMPKLFIHSGEDREVPISHGRRLFELAGPPKEFLQVTGGHTTAYKVDPGFYQGVARFMAGLGFPVSFPSGAP